jgi:uncharacterized tellurite resistance protein B-like protein
VIAPQQLVSCVGTPTGEHLAYAARLMDQLPDSLRLAAHEPARAPALVCGLLLSTDENVRARQIGLLRERSGGELLQTVETLLTLLSALDERAKLPLIELTFPALRRMSAAEYEAFGSNIEALVNADLQIDLFEFALGRMLRRHLEPVFRAVRRPEVHYYALSGLANACSAVVSSIAHSGQDTPARAQAAFERGLKRLGAPSAQFRFMALEDCTLNTLEISLNNLAEAAPRLKKVFLEACAETVASDGVIHPREAEMLRAIADALDCPVPPFVSA